MTKERELSIKNAPKIIVNLADATSDANQGGISIKDANRKDSLMDRALSSHNSNYYELFGSRPSFAMPDSAFGKDRKDSDSTFTQRRHRGDLNRDDTSDKVENQSNNTDHESGITSAAFNANRRQRFEF